MNIAKSFSELMKFNPYHGKDGRFTGPNGYASFSANPNTKAGKLAIRREQKNNPLVGAAYGTKHSPGQIRQEKRDKQSAAHAKQLLSDYEVSENKKALIVDIQDLYRTADRTGNIRLKEDGNVGVKRSAIERAKEISSKAADSATYTDYSTKADYDALRRYVKNTPLKISDYDRSNIADFNAYRRNAFGNITISNRGLPIDTFYQEITGQFPHLFNDKNISNPADQLTSINDAINSLKPRTTKLSGEMKDQFISSMTNDIIRGYIMKDNDFRMAKSFYDILKFNPYHGKDGRFTGPGGFASFSANPNTKAGKLAIERASENHPLIGAAYGGGSTEQNGHTKEQQNKINNVKRRVKENEGFSNLHFEETGENGNVAYQVFSNSTGNFIHGAINRNGKSFITTRYKNLFDKYSKENEGAKAEYKRKREEERHDRELYYKAIERAVVKRTNAYKKWKSFDTEMHDKYFDGWNHRGYYDKMTEAEGKKWDELRAAMVFRNKRGNWQIAKSFSEIVGINKIGKTDKYTLFIGLKVNDLERLAVDGGEDPEDFHITLAYGYFTPQSDEEDTTCRIQNAIERARYFIPDKIRFDAIDRFEASESSDGKDVIIARVAAGQLEQVHNGLIQALKKEGITLEDTFPDYKPHMTLAYIDPGEDYELSKIDETGTVTKILIGHGKDTEESKENTFSIKKADEDKRLVFGWANIAIRANGEQIVDLQQDMMDPEDLEEGVYQYVLNFRDAGEEHMPGYRKKARMVESVVFTEEKLQAMGIPSGTVPLGWWIGFYVDDDKTWELIKNGTYKMFSIEGKGTRMPVKKSAPAAQSFNEILKFNPYHGKDGRFTGPGGYSSFSANPQTKAGKLAIERASQNHPLIGAAYGNSGNGHGKAPTLDEIDRAAEKLADLENERKYRPDLMTYKQKQEHAKKIENARYEFEHLVNRAESPKTVKPQAEDFEEDYLFSAFNKSKSFFQIAKFNQHHSPVNGQFTSGGSDIGSGGYSGRSMSNRAVRAYENGEKPKSKWTKGAMLEGIDEIANDNDIDVEACGVKRLTAKELQDNFLERSSWHHTGAMYNRTDFYSIKQDAVSSLTKDKVDSIVNSRTRKVRTKEEKEKIKQEKQTHEDSKSVYRKLDVILASNTTGLKNINGVYNRWDKGKLDLESEYKKALDKLRQQEEKRVEQWRKLPADHWRQKQVKMFDDNPEKYVLDNLSGKSSVSTKVLNQIKTKLKEKDGVAKSFSEIVREGG